MHKGGGNASSLSILIGMLFFIGTLLDKCLWGTSGMPFEYFREIHRIGKSACCGDLGNGDIAVFNLPAGVLDPKIVQILGKTDVHILFKDTGQVLWRIRELLSQQV